MSPLAKPAMAVLLLGAIIAAGLFALPPRRAHAQVTYGQIMDQGIIFAGICSSRTAACECRDSGNCTLDNILQVFVNVSVFILGISGSVVLLMFVYGGFVWLTAQGNPQNIKSGKDILIGSVIGLIIIFGAYAAITILISVLKTGDLPATGTDLEDVAGGAGIINTVE